MPESPGAMDELARLVRTALEAADLSSFRAFLDPDVTWGAPGARRPTCRNRDQVLAWYERGRDAGVRAEVSDVSVVGDRLLVSMTVHGTETAEDRGGAALRWQVLTVRDGRIVDIVGFDDRSDATAHAGASTSDHPLVGDASHDPGPTGDRSPSLHPVSDRDPAPLSKSWAGVDVGRPEPSNVRKW